MKYYSELLKEMFDNVDELNAAEKALNTQVKEMVKEAISENNLDKENATIPAISLGKEVVNTEDLVVKRKRELAKNIEVAEKALEEAYAKFELAKSKCKKILEESNEQMCSIIDPASNDVRVAEMKKFEAISKFNEEFGPFRTMYTGDRAAREFDRAMERFNSIFDSLIMF